MAIRGSRIFPFSFFFSKAPFHDMRVQKRTSDISKTYSNVKGDNYNLRLTDASEFIPSVERLGLKQGNPYINIEE